MDEPGADSSYVYLTGMQVSPRLNGAVGFLETQLINPLYADASPIMHNIDTQLSLILMMMVSWSLFRE